MQHVKKTLSLGILAALGLAWLAASAQNTPPAPPPVLFPAPDVC